MPEKITKEMGLTEIIQKKPKAAEIMVEYGLHCLGCMASHFESLEQGAAAHGLTERQIEDMVKKINNSDTKEQRE